MASAAVAAAAAAAAAAGRIRVLVFPFPVQGHINPMLQFAKRLGSKGLKVTLVSTTSSSKSMQLAEGGSISSNSVNIETIFDGIGIDDEGAEKMIDSFDVYLERFRVGVTRSLAELIQNIIIINQKQNNANYKLVLVYDSVIPWALDIAWQLGLYGAASFFTQSCAVRAIYYHVNQGALNINNIPPLPHLQAQGSNSMLLSVPSMPLLRMNDLPSFIYDIASYPSLLTLVLNQFSNIHKADWLFFNTFDKLEHEVLFFTNADN